ncbi:MAG: hypothetical protein ACMZI0_02205 [Symbiopectobacterium sp.]|uniref:hypothetical protein n=1 Tax=Symbiopectobacterium sp. TaxID=2952789 RepID=UPI0039E96BEA
MPIKFERVDVDVFMSTYLSFNHRDRISHDDLDKMGKVAKGLDFATNGLDLFRRMKIKDHYDMDKRLAPLFEKLINQQSKHYDKKKDKLTVISEALKRQVTKDPNLRDHYISRYKNNLNQIKIEKSLIEKEILKHTEIKNSNVDKAECFKRKSEECSLQLKALLNDDAETVIKKVNNNLSETKRYVASFYNELSEISRHAQKNISNLDYILRLAADNKIYSAKDIGFGPTTWKSYLSGDTYAKKYFGTQRVYGRRKYIEREIPSAQGKKWQSTLIDYCNAYAALKEYKNALKKGSRDGLCLTERCRMTLEKDISYSIDTYDKKYEKYTNRA